MTGRGNLTRGEYVITQTNHDYCLCHNYMIIFFLTVSNYYSNCSNREMEHNTQVNILLRLNLQLHIILFNFTCKYNNQTLM